MRLTGIMLLAMGLSPMVWAQDASKITYMETASFNLSGVEGLDSAMLASLPKSSSSGKEVIYTADYSLYQGVQKQEAAESSLEDKPGIVFNMNMPDNKCYVDFRGKKVIRQEDFMGKLFLIEGNLETPQWKLTGKQANILGYMCQEALLDDSLQSARVWFAPQLQAGIGPDRYIGFPGTVLRVEIQQGMMVIEATAIEKEKQDKNLIKRPKEGKKVSEEEFAAICQEKMREMQEQYGTGSNGNVIIKVIGQ